MPTSTRYDSIATQLSIHLPTLRPRLRDECQQQERRRDRLRRHLDGFRVARRLPDLADLPSRDGFRGRWETFPERPRHATRVYADFVNPYAGRGIRRFGVSPRRV